MDFQTPKWCCEYMVSLIEKKKCSILEPTLGEGNLVDVLEENGHFVITPKSDFWELSDGRYDYIVMNPPFTPMSKGYDILYQCMEWTNNIIALMPWLILINSEKRTEKINNYGLKSVTHLPRKTFPGSRVQCCVLEMEKKYYSTTHLKFLKMEKTQNKWRVT